MDARDGFASGLESMTLWFGKGFALRVGKRTVASLTLQTPVGKKVLLYFLK